MLIAQAVLSFEIWTDYKPPREVMLGAVSQPA
jgi:shikimate 5-dehydrogenase